MNRITEAVMEHGGSKHDSTINTNIESLIGGHIASDTYTGNDSANRARPHGLGVRPAAVKIQIASAAGVITLQTPSNLQFISDASGVSVTVTDMDATNFYVGNITNYNLTGNGNAQVYNWVAIA